MKSIFERSMLCVCGVRYVRITGRTALPLSLIHISTEEQRSVIRFLVAEGVKHSEIHEGMLKVYRNHCFLFGPLKEALRGKKFGSNEEVKIHVQNWLRQQPTEFYARGIRKLSLIHISILIILPILDC